MSELLVLNNVEVTYDKFILAVKGVSLRVPKGSIVALLGPNGAGKSTVLKAISGIARTERGEVTMGEIIYDGEDVTNKTPEYMVKIGVQHILEGRRIFSELTVEENIKAAAGSLSKSEIDEILENFPPLKARLKVRAGYISGGEQQMLVLAMALLKKPRLILMDEPSLGLAPKLVAELFKTVNKIREQEGISILLCEQNTKAALSIADYGYVMESGRVLLEGTRDSLINREEVKEFYLGLRRGGRRSFAEVKHYKITKRWI